MKNILSKHLIPLRHATVLIPTTLNRLTTALAAIGEKYEPAHIEKALHEMGYTSTEKRLLFTTQIDACFFVQAFNKAFEQAINIYHLSQPKDEVEDEDETSSNTNHITITVGNISITINE